MLKKIILLFTIMLLTACPGYKLVPIGENQQGNFTITTQTEWNKRSIKVGKKSSTWTKDGATLNELIFVDGLKYGQTIYTSVNKSLPMPKYSKKMLPNDLMEFIITSMKNQQNGKIDIKTMNLRPTKLANGDTGFHFDLSFFEQKFELAKKGEAIAIIKGGKLYILIYTAAALHYAPKDKEEIDALFSTLTLRNKKK